MLRFRVLNRGVLLGLGMALGISSASFAKEERTPIDRVNVKINYETYNESEVDVQVTTDTEHVEIGDFYINNDPIDDWAKGESPELVITLEADEDYYFRKSGKSLFGFSGDSVYFGSADKFEDKQYVTLRVMLEPVGGELGNPLNLAWSTTGVGSWDAGFGNRRYKVTLHRNNSEVADYETNKTSQDFKAKIIEYGTGNYKFKVRAFNSDGNTDWMESYEIEVGLDELENFQALRYGKGEAGSIEDGPGGSNQDNKNPINPINPSGARPTDQQLNNIIDEPGRSGLVKGWIRDQVGWWYRNDDLSWTKNDWQLINGKWYWFNDQGYMVTGWIFVGGNWYYLDSSGAMVTGLIEIDGYKYFMTESGAMYTGYKYMDNEYYYFNANNMGDYPFGALMPLEH